jgi:hypothetical protein
MRIFTLVIWACLVASRISDVHAQETLQAPASFQAIGDRAQRARAIFTELGKVLMHPRCMNCHPAGDQPLQGVANEPHFSDGTSRWQQCVRGVLLHLSHRPKFYGASSHDLSKHSWPSSLGPRTTIDGMGEQIARRNLSSNQGSEPQRGPRLGSFARAHG